MNNSHSTSYNRTDDEQQKLMRSLCVRKSDRKTMEIKRLPSSLTLTITITITLTLTIHSTANSFIHIHRPRPRHSTKQPSSPIFFDSYTAWHGMLCYVVLCCMATVYGDSGIPIDLIHGYSSSLSCNSTEQRPHQDRIEYVFLTSNNNIKNTNTNNAPHVHHPSVLIDA